MEDYRCFRPGCLLNIEYECSCSSPPVYTCKMHMLNHMKVPNKDHALKTMLIEPPEKTRDVILNPKYDSIEDFNKKFKEEEKIQRNITVEEDLKEKSEILENSKILELERKLNSYSSACESNSSTPEEESATLAHPNIFSNIQHKTSLFNIFKNDCQTNLLIYSTDIESQASIILDTPQPLSQAICIAQLPNGKLFCFGNNPASGVTLLIDENYRVQELQSGTACRWSSAIYFNNNVYCFGGYIRDPLTLSNRFDLDRNQWDELTPLPNANYACNSIIFNGSILISGYNNKNIVRYSIDSNSFSTIPYDFALFKRKIIINADRLYLIECGESWSIYEGEIESDTSWRKIANDSTFNFIPTQTYCQYNKGEIYIGCIDYEKFLCFKFNLNEKRLIKLV